MVISDALRFRLRKGHLGRLANAVNYYMKATGGPNTTLRSVDEVCEKARPAVRPDPVRF